MTCITARMVCAALVVAAVTAPLSPTWAQSMGGGGQKHQQKSDKNAPPAPKVDEKAYAAALKDIPDKKYDPWHGVR